MHSGLGSLREDSGAERAAASLRTLVLSTSSGSHSFHILAMRCHRHSVLVIISFVLDFFFLFIGLQPQSLLRGARQIRTIVSEAMRSMDSRRKLKTYPKHQNILRDQQFLPCEYRALHSSTGRYTPHDFTPATIMLFSYGTAPSPRSFFIV